MTPEQKLQLAKEMLREEIDQLEIYSYQALDTAYDKLYTWVDEAVILTRKEYERLRHEAAAHSLKYG